MKKLYIFVSLLLALTALAGCAGKNADTAADAQTEDTVTVTDTEEPDGTETAEEVMKLKEIISL